MANPILVTGTAGRVGRIGRTVTELLLKQGTTVRAMVRVITGCETVYLGMSVSSGF